MQQLRQQTDVAAAESEVYIVQFTVHSLFRRSLNLVRLMNIDAYCIAQQMLLTCRN
jgi:hypothetical protein